MKPLTETTIQVFDPDEYDKFIKNGLANSFTDGQIDFLHDWFEYLFKKHVRSK